MLSGFSCSGAGLPATDSVQLALHAALHSRPAQLSCLCSPKQFIPHDWHRLPTLCPTERLTVGGSLIGGIKETQEMLGALRCAVLRLSALLACCPGGSMPSVAALRGLPPHGPSSPPRAT